MFLWNASGIIESCVFASNYVPSSTAAAGAIYVQGGDITLDACSFSDNVRQNGVVRVAPGNITLTDCEFGSEQSITLAFGGTVQLKGSNTIDAITGTSATQSVTIFSGAIVDLTGNTNATPINPGGGIVVSGGCTVVNSAGASVSIAGGTYSQINNDGTTVPAQEA